MIEQLPNEEYFRIPNYKKKDYVHIAKLPDMFRGKYKYDDEEAGLKYAKEV